MSPSIAKSIAIAIKSNKHFRSTISKFDRDENNKHNRNKKKQKVISDEQLVHDEDQLLIRQRREIEMNDDYDYGMSLEEQDARWKYNDSLYYIERRREREVNNNDNIISFKQELASLRHEAHQWVIRQRRKREEKTEKMMFNRFIIKCKQRAIDREQQNEVNTNNKNIDEDKKMIKKKEEEMLISLKIFQKPWMRNELVYSYLTKNSDMYNVR